MSRKEPEIVDPVALMVRRTEEAWDDWLTMLTPKSQLVCEQLTATAPPSTAPQYHVLLIPEMAEPEMLVFDSPQDVAELLRTKVNEKALKVFIFVGWRARISKKPFQYLVLPNGVTHPLFDLPNQVEIEDNDMLGPDPDREITSTIGDDYEDEEVEENWEDVEEAEEEDAEDGDEDDDDEDEDIEVP